mgnify:CR=1 FL=1
MIIILRLHLNKKKVYYLNIMTSSIISNVYIVSLFVGIFVYFLTYKSSKGSADKVKKQHNLNYAFLATMFTYIAMTYYNTNSGSTVEPTLKSSFDE